MIKSRSCQHLTNDIPLLEVLLDCSFYMSSLGQNIGVGGLFHDYTSQAHEKNQKNVLDYQKDRDELDLFLLHWSLELSEQRCLGRTICLIGHLSIIHILCYTVKIQFLRHLPHQQWSGIRDWLRKRCCYYGCSIRYQIWKLGLAIQQIFTRFVQFREKWCELLRAKCKQQNVLYRQVVTVRMAV